MNANDNVEVTLSPMQRDFLTECLTGVSSITLVAVAGAGKTFTIMLAVGRMKGQSAILAYNKKIADELKAKLKQLGIDWKRAQAGTVHSFGFSAFRKQFPKVDVNENKVANLVEEARVSLALPIHLMPYTTTVLQLVSLAKQAGIGLDAVCKLNDRLAWHDIIDHFDLLDNEGAQKLADEIVSFSMRMLEKSNAQTDIIDFDDMVYLPLIHRVKFWEYDNVFVDEAQDTNAVRRLLVKALVRKDRQGNIIGRVIAVGDPCQAIYGFTGADADSLDLITKEFNAKRMPLTVTYRCPKKIVSFARQWVSHIEAHETAPEGKISYETFESFLSRKDLDANAAVLSRTTKPLVTAAFALIRERIACKIEGRDIGNGLKKLATRWSTIKTINALDERLGQYLDRETAKWKAKKNDKKVQEVEDRVDTLRVIMERCREERKSHVSDVVAYIEGIFSDNVTGMLTLSTIHKSKGREFKRVFWLDRVNTCPSPYAKQDWEKGQERNLQYVAATRAMEELIELSAPAFKVHGKPEAAQKAA